MSSGPTTALVVTPSPYNPPKGTMGSETTRARLMDLANITEKEQAQVLRESWDTQRSLLQAKTTKVFAHEGIIVDKIDLEDNRVQLDAAESIERMLGVIAPRADQKVTVVHKLELPAWAMADKADPITINIEGKVE